MPHANIVEWVAGGTLPQQRRRQKRLERAPAATDSKSKANDSSCSTSCSCSSCCDSCSETSADSASKKVHFKEPKGILKNARKAEKEQHRCCSACSSNVHCNERHAVGKNGEIYGSSKKCAPRERKKGVNERNANTNSPTQAKGKSNPSYKSNNNWSKSSISPSTPINLNDIDVQRVQLPPSPPQTPTQRRAAQHLSSFINRNMSRLILPSRAEVIIREDVLENPSDPRPNAFFDARTGMLRVYHGPMYGNPGGSLVPLQAQHVPIGTPAPPTSAWSNPWAGMMNGMSGMWPFGVNPRGSGVDFRKQYNGNAGNANYSSSSNNRNNFNSNSNNNNDNSSGDSNPMPGSYNDDDQKDGSGWETSKNDAKGDFNNTNTNDAAWGSADNNDNSNDTSGDAWGAGTPNDNNNNNKNNNASSGNDVWGPGGGSSGKNNNGSSNNKGWTSNNQNRNPSNANQNKNYSSRQSNNNNNYSQSPPNKNFSNPTATLMSAGSWGADNAQGPTAGGNGGENWARATNEEPWGDTSAAQSTKHSTDDAAGW